MTNSIKSVETQNINKVISSLKSKNIRFERDLRWYTTNNLIEVSTEYIRVFRNNEVIALIYAR